MLHLIPGEIKLHTSAALEEAMQKIVNESNNHFWQYRINYIAMVLTMVMLENY